MAQAILAKLLYTTLLLATGVPAMAAPSAAQVFAVAKEPGTGAVTFKKSDTANKLAFGAEGGNFVFAIAIPTSTLPSPYKEEFKSKYVVQLVMGALVPKAEAAPQFSSATLLLDKIPVARTSVKLSVPPSKDALVTNAGVWMFSPPPEAAVTNLPDDERLKGTYFATSGVVGLAPLTPEKPITLQAEGKSYPFKHKKFKADLSTELNTPFNPQVASLEGAFEFTLFWPNGKSAERLTRDLAAQTLGAGKPSPVSK